MYQAARAIREGKLVSLLRGYAPEPLPVHLVHTGPPLLPLKMRAFLDFAGPRLKANLADIENILHQTSHAIATNLTRSASKNKTVAKEKARGRVSSFPPNDLDRFSIMITHWFRSREFSRNEMCVDLNMIRTGKLGLCVDHAELGDPLIAATETAASAPFPTQKEALAIDAAVQHKDPSFH